MMEIIRPSDVELVSSDSEEDVSPATSCHETRQPAESSATSIEKPVTLLIQRLPGNASEEHLRSMFSRAKDLFTVTVLSDMEFDEPGFHSAIVTFSTAKDALKAKRMLGKRANSHRDYQVIVSVLSQERPTIHDLEDAAREALAHAAASMERQQ
jgi:hypothetical protein